MFMKTPITLFVLSWALFSAASPVAPRKASDALAERDVELYGMTPRTLFVEVVPRSPEPKHVVQKKVAQVKQAVQKQWTKAKQVVANFRHDKAVKAHDKAVKNHDKAVKVHDAAQHKHDLAKQKHDQAKLKLKAKNGKTKAPVPKQSKAKISNNKAAIAVAGKNSKGKSAAAPRLSTASAAKLLIVFGGAFLVL